MLFSDGTAANYHSMTIRFIQGLYLLPWIFTVVEDLGNPGTSRAVNGEHNVLRSIFLGLWLESNQERSLSQSRCRAAGNVMGSNQVLVGLVHR